MPQVHSSTHSEDDDAPADVPAASATVQTDAVDALLDEIDVSLEQNSEQFVRSFVQKGGQ